MALITVQLQVTLPNAPKGTRLEVDDQHPLVQRLIANRRYLVVSAPAEEVTELTVEEAKPAKAAKAAKSPEPPPEAG